MSVRSSHQLCHHVWGGGPSPPSPGPSLCVSPDSLSSGDTSHSGLPSLHQVKLHTSFLLCLIVGKLQFIFVNYRKDERNAVTILLENNRNWSLFAAQISFLCFSGLESQVPKLPCQIFSMVIHYFYMVFFTWTGKS